MSEAGGMVVIVGAGVSGLALGLHLRDAGIPYVILEATDRVGGVIRTIEVEGHRLELGPQRLRASPELAPFLKAMGELRAIPGDPVVSVARGGRLHPLPRTLGEALRTPAVSLPGKLRAALEPVAAALPVPDEISAGAYLRRRVGREVYETFLGPLFGGLYGSDPDRMDAHRTLLPGIEALGVGSFVGRLIRGRGRGEGARRSPDRGARPGLLDRPVIVPVGGMQMLPRTLHDLQPDAVRLSCPVTGVEPHPEGSGFRVETAGEGLRADRVVLTAPPAPVAGILAAAAPELAAALRVLRMNPLVLVHLEVQQLPPGLGFQVSFGEPARMRGATFSGNLDGTGRTAVVFMGGTADPAVEQTPDETLAQTAAREFTELTGAPARPIHLHRTAMPAWDRSWSALDDVRIPAGIHPLAAWSGRPGILGRLREAARLSEALTSRG